MAGSSPTSMLSAEPSPSSTPWLRMTNQLLVGIGLAVSTSCLLMRLHTKIHIMKRFWWDDVFLIFAWIFSIAAQAIILYGFEKAGIGLHITELSTPTIAKLQKTVLAASIIYIPCLAFAKLALLMLYYKLLNLISGWVYTLYFVGAVIVGYSIALLLALIFACNPLAKNWNPGFVGGSCINRPALYMTTAATNAASDLVLLFIPIQVVRKLQMRFVEKMGAIFMFGIGCLTTITSVIRLATLWPLITATDISYKLALVCTFVSIEANFIILCGSIPYFRQFFRHYMPRWVPGYSGSELRSDD